MPGFVEVGLNQLLGAFALATVIATLVGHFIFGLGTSKKGFKDAAIKDLRDVVDAQGKKIGFLEEGLKGCKTEHANCEIKVNTITAFNLRLQAREQVYQRTINRLEGKLGVEITDFNEVSHAPEDSDFG